MACVCAVPGECDVLSAAISAKVLPVGCVTPMDADVDAACILDGPMLCFIAPVAGKPLAGASWLHVNFWKTLGCKVANSVGAVAPAPDRAWVPWASSLVCRRHAQPGRRRWVAGVTGKCTSESAR